MTAGAEPWCGSQASGPGPDLRAQHELSDTDGTQGVTALPWSQDTADM